MPRKRARAFSKTAAPTGAGDRRRGRAPRPIPSPTAPGFLSLYDGQSLLATYVERDGSHFLFDSSGVLIGSFKSRAAAMRAIPAWGRS